MHRNVVVVVAVVVGLELVVGEDVAVLVAVDVAVLVVSVVVGVVVGDDVGVVVTSAQLVRGSGHSLASAMRNPAHSPDGRCTHGPDDRPRHRAGLHSTTSPAMPSRNCVALKSSSSASLRPSLS